MRRNLLVIITLLLGITAMQAKPVDVATAQRLGRNFIQHKAMFAKNAVNDLELAYTCFADNGMATAYVFNFDGGYVIVAADDCSSPILGYSDQGSFDYETAPDGLRYMLGELSNDIEKRVQLNQPVPSDILCRWKNLEAYGMMHPERGQVVVEPLVQTKWDQGAPFNMYVPAGCPTGCVATAMAQLMKYWEWPVTGTGEHSYFAMGYGEQYANFGATTYDWDNMIESYNAGANQEQKEAVATLMYHCGVSVDMMYAPDGSGAFSQDVPVAINNYFSYSEHATHISRAHSYNDWIALLKTNIDQRIPLYYSGQSQDGGHAFICDGYDVDDLFHFNYGWGGSGGGFLLIDGENFEFSGSQAIVYDFVPDFVYDQMPKAPENLSVSIDSDVSRIGHLSWINPTETVTGEALTGLEKIIVKRNGFVVHEITDVAPGQAMTYDDEVPFFDQFDYTVQAVNSNNYGRTISANAVFGPYCDWKVIMTSASFQGWDGGGITVQNAAGSYIDFLTTTQATASMQTFQMALGNNNLYWVEPNSIITNLSFKIRDAENQIVYQYEGPSTGLEAGLLRTLNNSCGNVNTCEAPYNLKASVDPDNDRNVILTWESDHNPEFGYNIYRDGFLFNMAHETNYVDENTDIGGHCYYVTALCTGGETANSNEYCVTSGTGCEPPQDLYFDYFNGNKIQLFWSPTENENVTGYVVYRKTEDAPYKRIKNVGANTTNCKDTSVTPGTQYQYVVTAYYRENDCNSGYANDLFDKDKFFIGVNWSNSPQDLQAELVENDEESHINLRWKPAYQASSYDVMRNGVRIGEVNETVFVDENLEEGETYCYQITAHGDGFETASNEACVTVDAPEPPVLPCSAPTNLRREDPFAMAHIAWDAPEDRAPESYTVVVINHLTNETINVAGITDLYYEEAIAIDVMDKSYKVKAVYPECESDFALNADGDDFVRITNLAVDENSLLNVKLYPNPTSGQLSIEAEEMTSVYIYDIVGQCLMQIQTNEGQATLDMSQMQNGIYFIKVNTTNGSVVQRVVKM
jgi:fibronectin type 3 domain-containing protein